MRTDPSFTEKESGIQSLQSGIESVESKIQFPYMGARLHASDSTDSQRVSKLELFALQDLSTNRSLGNMFETINFPRRILSKEKNMETDGHN